jgi:hypothetical protein
MAKFSPRGHLSPILGLGFENFDASEKLLIDAYVPRRAMTKMFINVLEKNSNKQ